MALKKKKWFRPMTRLPPLIGENLRVGGTGLLDAPSELVA